MKILADHWEGLELVASLYFFRFSSHLVSEQRNIRQIKKIIFSFSYGKLNIVIFEQTMSRIRKKNWVCEWAGCDHGEGVNIVW